MPSNFETRTCLQRTAQAWCLLPHPHTLGRKAHTLLLLANGHRTLSELSLLAGINVAPLAMQLMEQGLLQPVPMDATTIH